MPDVGTEKQHHKDRTPPVRNCSDGVHALLLRLRTDTMQKSETPVKRNARRGLVRRHRGQAIPGQQAPQQDP